MQPVRIDQLESSYGKDVVLRVSNVAVERGDFLRILGPNGGGKSTLLNVLLGRKTFTGIVSIYGDSEPPFELAKGQVAYLAQDANQVDPNFPIRVKDVVAMGLLGRSRTWLRLSQDDRNAIQEALDAVQMGHLGKKRIGTLSGGQRQRVMLARAIVRKPDLLLLDEPFTAIDPKGRGAFADLLARLNQSGTTILAVCHEPELLEGIANRTVSIDVELVEVEVNHGA